MVFSSPHRYGGFLSGYLCICLWLSSHLNDSGKAAKETSRTRGNISRERDEQFHSEEEPALSDPAGRRPNAPCGSGRSGRAHTRDFRGSYKGRVCAARTRQPGGCSRPHTGARSFTVFATPPPLSPYKAKPHGPPGKVKCPGVILSFRKFGDSGLDAPRSDYICPPRKRQSPRWGRRASQGSGGALPAPLDLNTNMLFPTVGCLNRSEEKHRPRNSPEQTSQ